MDEPYVRIDWRQSIDAVVKKLIHFAFSGLLPVEGPPETGVFFK